MLQTDVDEGRQLLVELALIEQNGVLPDQTGGLHLTDALDHGGGGELHPRADVSGVHTGIFLETGENFPV